MDNLDQRENKVEKYIVRLLIGLTLVMFIFIFRNYIDENEIVDKSRRSAGYFHSFDLMYYSAMIIGLSASIFLILPSLVYLLKKLFTR